MRPSHGCPEQHHEEFDWLTDRAISDLRSMWAGQEPPPFQPDEIADGEELYRQLREQVKLTGAHDLQAKYDEARDADDAFYDEIDEQDLEYEQADLPSERRLSSAEKVARDLLSMTNDVGERALIEEQDQEREQEDVERVQWLIALGVEPAGAHWAVHRGLAAFDAMTEEQQLQARGAEALLRDVYQKLDEVNVARLLAVVPVLHHGWELDEWSWVFETADGVRCLVGTDHGSPFVDSPESLDALDRRYQQALNAVATARALFD